MAKSSFGQVSFKDRAADRLRQIFVLSLAGSVIGGAGYYQYGTVHEIEGTVSRFNSENWVAGEDGSKEGYYLFELEDGRSLRVEESILHNISEDDVEKLYRDTHYGKPFKFKVYGHEMFGLNDLNLLAARPVDEKELQRRELEKARQEAELKKRDAAAAAAAAASQPGAVIQGQTPQPAQVTYNVPAQQIPVPTGYIQMNVNSPDGRHTVQIALPAEFGIAASRIVVTGINPVQPPAPVITPAPKP